MEFVLAKALGSALLFQGTFNLDKESYAFVAIVQANGDVSDVRAVGIKDPDIVILPDELEAKIKDAISKEVPIHLQELRS